jgi:tRNA nucleotidyltransferase (CCA-adding enzyme)
VEALCERLKAPNDVRELALLACRNRVALRAAPLATPAALLELLKRTDAFRRPERFAQLCSVARYATPGLDSGRLERALAAAAGVDAGAIAASAPTTGDIPRLIDEARTRAIAHAA